MDDHAIALTALGVSILGALGNLAAIAWTVIRHCRRDEFERGKDRARLDALEGLQELSR